MLWLSHRERRNRSARAYLCLSPQEALTLSSPFAGRDPGCSSQIQSVFSGLAAFRVAPAGGSLGLLRTGNVLFSPTLSTRNPMPLFVGFQYLVIFVITAIGTNAMREFCFLAARAERHSPQGELPVSPTFIAARLRGLSLRNWHQSLLASLTRSANLSTARTESPAFPRRTDN
jgi:hypothetical protein